MLCVSCLSCMLENVGREWSLNLDFCGKKWKDLGMDGCKNRVKRNSLTLFRLFKTECCHETSIRNKFIR